LPVTLAGGAIVPPLPGPPAPVELVGLELLEAEVFELDEHAASESVATPATQASAARRLVDFTIHLLFGCGCYYFSEAR
jgi:hypothetical protein